MISVMKYFPLTDTKNNANISSLLFLILGIVSHPFLAPSWCEKSSDIATEVDAEAIVTAICYNSSWLKGLDKMHIIFY